MTLRPLAVRSEDPRVGFIRIPGIRNFRICRAINTLHQPVANVIKLFTEVIYRHSMVIPSFCVIKLCYHGNNRRMAVNYLLKKFYTIGHGDKLKYRGKLPRHFNSIQSRLKITEVTAVCL
jgi:hypothetical protein